MTSNMTSNSSKDMDGLASYENLNTYPSDDVQKVSLFTVRGYSFSSRYRLATGILGLLSAALLMAVIAMAVIKHVNETQLQQHMEAQAKALQSKIKDLEENNKNASLYTAEVEKVVILSQNLEEAKAQVEQLQSQVKALEERNKEQSLCIPKLGRHRSCPSDWRAMNNRCFYFPDKSSRTRKSWSESRADCVRRGADLAVVDTLEKQTFISDILNVPGAKFSPYNGYWIGLRDKVNEQTWTWISGSSLTKAFWMDGEPNDYRSNPEDCAATYPTSNPLKTWNDASCSYSHRWICEKEAAETP